MRICCCSFRASGFLWHVGDDEYEIFPAHRLIANMMLPRSIVAGLLLAG